MEGEDRSNEGVGGAEIAGDPSRQAVWVFKGIDYQIWQTGLAWLSLKESELLVVEGAEDFDVVGAAEAVGNQVKCVAAPITLRSKCVCDALRNFWTLRHKNPSQTVGLRLITSANLSVEAGEPFGPSKEGLELWNEEAKRASPTDSDRLRRFLLSDPSVLKKLNDSFEDKIPSLVEHLRQLSPESFHNDFVRRIQWLARQPDIDVIRETVRVSLHAYGEDKHLLPRDSERALAPLFEHIAHVALKEHRALTRADFRVLFDDATRASVPLSQLNQMQAALFSGLQAAPSGSEINYSVGEIISIPDLPVPCAPRKALLDTFVASIKEHGFAAIQGSTGKGKSTLAKLLARQLGGKWIWISFANWAKDRVLAELERVARHVARSPQAVSLLLDDLNPDGADLPASLQKLAILSRLTIARGGRLIVTTQRLLNTVFLRQSSLPPAVLHQVITFRDDEIRELCIRSGCPPDHRLDAWVKVIASQTGRHPQLVHARTKGESRNNWPIPTTTDVLETPQEINDERQLARQLLQDLDDGDVQLLYRLSLASEPFRKDHAIAVGGNSPPIDRAGDRFDRLVGPWIEPVGNKYFRLSVLLSRAAEENWTTENVRISRIGYARAIQQSGDLTLREVNEILFQALIARDASLVGWALAALVTCPTEVQEHFARHIDWLLALKNPASAFPDNQFINHLFAVVRFRIAAASDSESAPNLAVHLFEQSNNSINPEVDSHIRVGAATDIILAMQVLAPPPLLLRCWLDVTQLMPQHEHLQSIARLIERQRPNSAHVFPEATFDEILFGFILSRRADSSYLLKFIAAVDALSSDDRGKVLAMMEPNRFRLFKFIDNAWTHELTKETADWNSAIAALEEALRAGDRWMLPDLCMIAARGIAAIQSEYLEQRDQALKTLADTAVRIGADGLVLRHQRGLVHYMYKEYAEAYQAWFSTLDEWPDDSEEAALYAFNAFSNCGAAAGFLHRWGEAAQAFGKGRDLAFKVRRRFDAARFGIDAAYALWRGNLRKEAVSEFAKYLNELEDLSKTTSSTEFHTQWKVTEHMIIWCAIDAGAPHKVETVAPRPGICSETKTKEKHALVKDAPRAATLLTWHSLAEAELYGGLGRDVFLATIARPDVNQHPNLRPMIEFLRARRAIADGEFASVPIFAESTALSFSIVSVEDINRGRSANESLSAPPTGSASVASFVEETLLCALVEMAAQNIPWDPVLGQWEASVEKMKDPSVLTTPLKIIKQIYETTARGAYEYYAADNATRFTRILGALRLATHPDATPAMCYVGLSSLVTDEGFATNMTGSHRAIAMLTQRVWSVRLSTTFDLRSPRITVPAIKAACECGKTGLALAATILLAAGDAVAVTKLASINQRLQSLASTPAKGR